VIMVIIMALVMSTFAISVSQQSRSRSSTLISDATEKQVLYLAEDAANQMIYKLNTGYYTDIASTPANELGIGYTYTAKYLPGVEPFRKGIGTVMGTGTYQTGAETYSKTVYVAVPSSTEFVYNGTATSFSTLVGGGVKVDANGNLTFNSTSGEQRVAFGQLTWTDYVVHVRATLASGNGYGIYYRCDGIVGSSNPGVTGYCFQYDPGWNGGSLIVRKVTNGSEASPFESVAIPANIVIYNQPHDIFIAVRGIHHVISVDGQVVLDFNDSWRTSGKAGLRDWGSTVTFSAIDVESVISAVNGTWRENY
jgi:hypothetical protein